MAARVCLVGLIAGGHSGVPRYAAALARALDSVADSYPDLSLILLTTAAGADAVGPQSLAVKIVAGRSRRVNAGPGRLALEHLALRRERADLFHFFDVTGPVLAPRRPFVATIHDAAVMQGYGLLRNMYKRRLYPWALARARALVAVSKFAKDETLRYFDVDPEKIAVVHVRCSRIIAAWARATRSARSASLQRVPADTFPRCTNSASATKRVVQPSSRARQKRSMSSAYMNRCSAKPPRSLHTSSRTAITAPVAAWIVLDSPWFQCVDSKGWRRFGTKRERPEARTSSGRGELVGTTLGWSVRSSFRRRGTASPTRGGRIASSSRRTLPGAWTNASLFTKRYAEAGRARAPALFPRAKPAFSSSATSGHCGSSARIRSRLPSPDALSTTTTCSGRRPSAINARADRIV